VTITRTVPAASTAILRPAAADTFHLLKALIKSKPDQGTTTQPSTLRASNHCLTRAKHW
jgi:hypothetical protein